MQASAAAYALTYFTTPKRRLATSTVVGLTTAKFKPLIFPKDAMKTPITFTVGS
jgi:hypothetical protein